MVYPRMDLDLNLFLRSGALLDLSPREVIVGWGERVTSAQPRERGYSFWFQPFFADPGQLEDGWQIFEHTAVLEKQDLLARLQKHTAGESGHPDVWAWRARARESYEESFRQAQDLIARGELQKIVLYSASEAAWEYPHRLSLIQNALAHERLYPFGIWDESWGWIGAAPEVLFEYADSCTVVIDALAGTVALEESERLRIDPKILLEQQLVVDDITRQVAELGEIEASPLDVYENAPLAHLRRRLTLRAPAPLSWRALLSALHPTAAVGGYPRVRAWEMLRALDREIPRRYYGAPIGATDGQGTGRCVVGLRGVFFEDTAKRATIWVGGGITSDSRIEAEWEELRLKHEAVRRWLGV